MGIYLNPDSSRFLQAVNSKIYVDKSQLISFTNERINTEQKNICVSRPRRFGKSINLAMLAAYYSKGCDSKELFDGLDVVKDKKYYEHLNKYHVIYINMQEFLSDSENIDDMISLLKQSIIIDLEDEFQNINLHTELGLIYSMKRAYNSKGVPFVILIDEWDCVMREHRNNKEALEKYLNMVHILH